MTILNYTDPYLEPFCTVDREERAFEHVDTYGEFADVWRNKLATLWCYTLACVENQGSPDDLFASKYKAYLQQFQAMLSQARAATPADDGITSSVFSVPLERA